MTSPSDWSKRQGNLYWPWWPCKPVRQCTRTGWWGCWERRWPASCGCGPSSRGWPGWRSPELPRPHLERWKVKWTDRSRCCGLRDKITFRAIQVNEAIKQLNELQWTNVSPMRTSGLKVSMILSRVSISANLWANLIFSAFRPPTDLS